MDVHAVKYLAMVALIRSQELVQKRNKVRNLETQCSSLTQELGLVKTQVLEGNYKVDNFDSVKRYRVSIT